MRFEHSIDIHRPVEEVFAFLTDPDKLPTWQTTTVEVRRTADGPLSAGERFGEVHAALGRRLESTVEVAEYEPPRAFAIRMIDGAVPLDGRWTLERANGGTRLHFVSQVLTTASSSVTSTFSTRLSTVRVRVWRRVRLSYWSVVATTVVPTTRSTQPGVRSSSV